MKQLKYIAILTCSLIFTVSTWASADQRSTVFMNNSNYKIKIWEQMCGEYKDGRTECTEAKYLGELEPHQGLHEAMPQQKEHDKGHDDDLVKVGDHVIRAEISGPGLTPIRTLFNGMKCSDIHEWNRDGALVFDVNSEHSDITCMNYTTN